MRFHRIRSVIFHAWHHMQHSRETWIDIGWFPVVTTLSLGGLTTYMSRLNNSPEAVFPLIAIVMWYALEVGNYSIALGALWEIWAKSFSSLFISPLSVEEFVFGHIIFSVFKQLIIISLLSMITTLLFGISPFIFGPMLPIYVFLLAIYGWGFGMFVFGLILRFGTGLQSLAWGLVFGLQPLIGIYYPIVSLPPQIQFIAKLLAPSHVMTSARNQLKNGAPLWDSIGFAFVLDMLALLFGYFFMKHMWHRARKTGALARMEE